MKKIPVHCRCDKLLPASDLEAKLHPDNPKTHPADQLRTYAKIIRGNGWRRAVVLSRRSGFITKGNGAVMACLAHGIDRVPVEWQRYASAAEELRDLSADNALASLGITDDAKLAALLAQLPDTDHELAGVMANLESEPPALQPLKIQPPPKMAWALIGIPVGRFGEIAPDIERIATLNGALVETTVNDAETEPDTTEPAQCPPPRKPTTPTQRPSTR